MNIKRHTEFKLQDGKLYQGVREPLPTKDGGDCAFCKETVYVSSGQMLTYFNGQPTHKRCRKEYEKSGKLHA